MAAKEQPVRYEYRTEKVLTKKVEKMLNKWAKDGWELQNQHTQLNAYDRLTLRRIKK